MTEEEYWAEIKRLGLKPTDIKTEKNFVYRTVYGEPHSVPDPAQLAEDDRKTVIDRLKRVLGIGSWTSEN